MIRFSPGCNCCAKPGSCRDPIPAGICTDSGFDASDTLEIRLSGDWSRYLQNIPQGNPAIQPEQDVDGNDVEGRWYDEWLDLENVCHDLGIEGDELDLDWRGTYTYDGWSFPHPVFGFPITVEETLLIEIQFDPAPAAGPFGTWFARFTNTQVWPDTEGGFRFPQFSWGWEGSIDGPAEACGTFDSEGFTLLTEQFDPAIPPVAVPPGDYTTRVRVK